jgi:hypothetical protein
MKSLRFVVLLVCMLNMGLSASYAQTRPHWLQINGVPIASVIAYGAVPDDGIDDTIAVNKALSTAGGVYFPRGTFNGDFEAPAGSLICGAGSKFTILTAKTAGRAALILGENSTWNYTTISGIQFNGDNQTRNGVSFVNGKAGRVAFAQCSFIDCDLGLDRSSGSIGISLESCNFSGNKIGMYNLGTTTMHTGCVDMNMCQFDQNDTAGVYIYDPYPVTGQFSIRNSVFEFNAGHNIYCAEFNNTPVNSLSIDNLWMESDLSSAPPAQITTPDGVTATSTELWLHNTSATINNMRFVSLNGSNSSIILNNSMCTYTQIGTYPSDVILENSSLLWTNRRGQFGGHPDGLTMSYASAGKSGQYNGGLNYLSVQKIPHRTHYTTGFAANRITAIECASTTIHELSDGSLATSTLGGLLFDRSIQIIATEALLILDWESTLGVHNAFPADKSVVWSVGVKRNNTDEEDLHSQLHLYTKEAVATGPYILGPAINHLPSGEWVTVGGIFTTISSYTATPSFHIGTRGHNGLIPGDYSVSGFQAVAFDSFEDANSFFSSGALARSDDGF